MRKSLPQLFISCVLFFVVFPMHTIAQVTTATLSGIVKDPKGTPLISANILVEYADAGIRINIITKADGRFTIPNLRVGGPYKITVTHVSYQEASLSDIFLELGLNNTVEFKLEERKNELNAVTVSSRSTVFDNKRTGASTNISNRQLRV